VALTTGRVRVVACLLLCGCASGPLHAWNDPAPEPPKSAVPLTPVIEPDVYARAERERSEFYEREVERLRADLEQAEQSLVAMESGLRGPQSRADAVSAVAEARISLERVSRSVPWRVDRVAEAREKLEEASRQLESDHLGSAVFFASRAQRITESLRAEQRQVAQWSERRVIRTDRANLRAGPSLAHRVVGELLKQTPVFPERAHADWRLVRTPSGQVGWVHASLLAVD
jgi:hypothetical protein